MQILNKADNKATKRTIRTDTETTQSEEGYRVITSSYKSVKWKSLQNIVKPVCVQFIVVAVFVFQKSDKSRLIIVI